MQTKSFKLLSIILMLLITMLILAGCGKSGNRFANTPPTIKITSFEGWDTSYVVAGYDTTTTYTFQQRIYWHATDPDGVIAGYAFRVLDEFNNPVPTPGYNYIDTMAELTPDNLLNAYGAGWVIHYLPNADQTLPGGLGNPAAQRTIWTSQKYAVINFPSSDANGNPITNYSKFEVVAIDNRGAITAESAWRNFKTTSARPTCIITTTKGNPDGKEVGAGIRLSFSMDDFDPYINPTPFKYEFQMTKVDLTGKREIPGTKTGWISTDSQEKINEYLLNLESNPPLEYDFNANGVAYRKTRIEARVTDLAGVVSIPDTNSVISFKIRPGFRPTSLVYPSKTYVMGDNHYEDWGDTSTPEVLPNTIAQGALRFASPMFRDMENKLTAVYSTNMKMWVRWGWWGEYGNLTGDVVNYGELNNLVPMPYGKKVDVVIDRSTGKNYYSEITNFDLRFDGEPYNFPPYANSIVTDSLSGDRWLRIPLTSPLGQTIVLTSGQLPAPVGTEPGHHTFQIRCVDLQGAVDDQPANLEFYLYPYIAPANRQGILLIDDDDNHATYSPDAIVAARYENMLADYNGAKTIIKRTSTASPGDTYPDARGRHYAFSDLQKYKMVIYHSDNIAASGNLQFDFDGLALYMIKGGNLVISHSYLLASVLESASVSGTRHTLLNYLGLNSNPALGKVSENLNTNYLFQKAVASASGYSDVNLKFGTGEDASFNSLVNIRHGLPAVSYFPSTFGDVIYRLGCKPVGYTPNPPTQAQFDLLNNKPVGIRRVSSNNAKAYTFGFPLSYMKEAEARAMMNKIISEVM